MRARWEIWTSTARGERLKLGGNIGSFGAGRMLNGIGEWYVNLPSSFDMSLVPLDNMVEFWRAPEAGPLNLFCVGFIKERERLTRGRRISGPDQNDILRTRIVAYAAGSTDAEITTYYDDMMKHIVRSNFGSLATDTDRDLSQYNFTVEANTSAAPSGSLAFARDNTLTVLSKIADASREAGTELYFDLVPTIQSDQSIGFDFRTYINQPGQDRTQDASNPVFFGEKFGNMLDALTIEDANDEINDVYVGGQGEEAARTIVQVENTTRIGRSPWNRREGFVNYSNADSTGVLLAAGQAEITARRPRKKFSGSLIDTPQARFGIDWGLGYRITCDHDGEQFDALIRQVDLEVDNEMEKISAKVEAEE